MTTKTIVWSPRKGNAVLAVRVKAEREQIGWTEYLCLLCDRWREMALKVKDPLDLYETHWWERQSTNVYVAPDKHIMSPDFEEMLANVHHLHSRDFPMKVRPMPSLEANEPEMWHPDVWLTNLL